MENAFTFIESTLALSSWPIRTNLADLTEDGERISSESQGDESSSDAQMVIQPVSVDSRISNSSRLLASESALVSGSEIDSPSIINVNHKDDTRIDTSTDPSSGEKRLVLTVPEFDEYMDTCEADEFVENLNHPDSVAIEGLSGWMSTMERKALKVGSPEFSLEFSGGDDEAASGSISHWDDVKWTEGTYLNCDLRYYDLGQIGKYDVVLVDPPWRLRGAQNVSDEKTMFNNNRFTLQYNTMSNEEIMDLEVGKLSDRGFIFLWTINSQLQTAFECLNRWGYTYVDRITWVKKTNKDSVFIGQGYYLLHSTEICLIGTKKDSAGNYLEVVQKVSNDLIFSPTQKKSQKPEQLYHIIERMFPGSRRVELFARNHNIRRGWLSLGNQLGPHYNWSHDDITCDECGHTIPICHLRYKHRTIANRDLCKACLSRSGETVASYFELQNRLDEQTFHDYYECNGCGANPLWGIRFTCDECPDFDLCESCHDQRVVPEELKTTHTQIHTFTAIETPEVAGGLAVHRHRCLGCNTFPIVGCRFKCSECSGNLSLCQKCFFAKKTPRSHLDTHDVQMITEPLLPHSLVRCDICKTKPIVGARYKCQQCFNFEICGNCHDAQRPPPANFASHKPTHTYVRVLTDPDVASFKEHKGGDKGWGPVDREDMFE